MIDELSRCPDPAAVHAELRERGAHRTPDGRWVVATAADVEAVLTSPHAGIGFAADPDRPVTARQARMARFTDGPEHAPRRAAAERLLAGVDPADLRRAAAAATGTRLADRTELDVMAELARTVPVEALAGALGIPDAAVAGDLARAIAPALGAEPAPGPETGDLPIAVLSLLFQAYDATAGLIGNAALRLGELDSADALITETLRRDCPVQLTIRLTTGPIDVGGETVPADERVVVVLGADFGFGHGPHACPGAEHAKALAAGVLDALIAAGARPVPGPVAHEPRLNLRIPTHAPIHLVENDVVVIKRPC